MRLQLPPSLNYPITITRLLKRPNDQVQRSEALFQYTYTTAAPEIDRDGSERLVDKSYPSLFESSVEGTLRRWLLAAGTVVERPGADAVDIDEPCAHTMQYGGMCSDCGRDMTELSYANQVPDAHRAPINMTHDNAALTVSTGEATRAERAAKRRLLAGRKLSLVVDLDQTIIHATVDPTVGEWMADPHSANHEAVRDVRRFQLVDDGPGGRGTWYYIKLRPGLKEFLENVSRIYELHIYTMGTRAYAKHIAELVDPDRRIFGDRILSRDESGSMVAKNLKRLFPVDSKMVVIIDDRGDVWNWTPNLVKVSAFSFFIGIGDINSSFLPQKPKIKLVSRKPTPDGDTKQVNGDTAGGESANGPDEPSDGTEKPTDVDQSNNSPAEDEQVSALDQLVSMSQPDTTTLEEQTAKQDEALNAQLQERPLLQKQKELDAQDDATASADPASSASPSGEHSRHHLLSDNDHELSHLEHALRATHAAFFDEYAARARPSSGGSSTGDEGATDIDHVPDIAAILPRLKARVLAGVALVFSGVIPLDADPQRADLALWARSFGARVLLRVSRRRCTHVVAARPRTAKVRQAARRGQGRIKVVGVQWLLDCLVRWRRLDETPYLMSTEDEGVLGRPLPGELDADELLSDSQDEASDDGADEAEGTESEAEKPLPPGPNGRPPWRLSVDTVPKAAAATTARPGDEDDEGYLPGELEDDKSPIGGTAKDWDEMDDELNDFLNSPSGEDDSGDGEEDDDDDGDDATAAVETRSSVSGRSSQPWIPRREKRAREEEEDDEDDAAEADGDSGGDRPPAAQKRRTVGRSPLASQLEKEEAAPGFVAPNGSAEDVDPAWLDFEAEMAGEAEG